MNTKEAKGAALAQGLLKAQAYTHPCQPVRLIETHISWVFLTGHYAYKVKKPVNFGFLDFSTREKRRTYCEEELRLNRRTAPQVYLEVVPITGSPERPQVGGDGEPIDFAVKMVEFPQSALFSRQFEEGGLTANKLDCLASQIARLHSDVDRADSADSYGTAKSIGDWALENFEQLNSSIRASTRLKRLSVLETWTVNALAELSETFRERKDGGFVRECHGDLHLGNITEIEGRAVLFDGIEFNDEIRWIDVLNEMAFLFTDLEHRGRTDFAWRTLNRYLELTGDYQGLQTFRFYRLYRIMVRAKIDSLRLGQEGLSERERSELETDIDVYLDQAESTVHTGPPCLVLMRGLSGSGKTFLSQDLVTHLGAIRLRSDLERKRMFGLAPEADSGSEVGEGIYSPEASRALFSRLGELSSLLLREGYHVIVDATFLRESVLQQFLSLGDSLGCAVRVLDIRAPERVLRERLAQRQGDASEADIEVLESQLQHYHPLEKEYSIPVDGVAPLPVEELVSQMRLSL